MEVRRLLPLVLLHVVTMCHIVNSGIQRNENIGDTQSVSPRPTTMQNITTLQCDHCPKKIERPTTYHTTVLPTDQTTQGPSPPLKPVEYIVVGVSGICLRMKAIFIVMQNTTKIRNITIPPPPITEVYGVCYDNEAWLDLRFPGGELVLIFIENKTNHVFYLKKIHISIRKEEEDPIDEDMSLESLVTPLGHSFTHKEVILRITPNVSLVLMDVGIEAFTRDWGNFGGECEWNSDVTDGESTFVTYDVIYEVLCILRSWSVTILVPSIYTVVFLVALPLNIMAIVMFLVKMKVRKPAVVYMLNLAIADVLLVCVLPFHIFYRFLGNNWIFGEGMCCFVTAAFYCNMVCSVLLMTSISVDRFLAVVYPVRSLPWRTVTRAWLVCGAIWVISLANIVPFHIGKLTWDSGRDITFCNDIQHLGFYFYFSYDYFPTVVSIFHFLPLFIITFCYIGIIRSLSRSAFDRTHKRSRAIRLSVIVLSVFVLCFGHTNVIYFISSKQMYKNYGLSLYIANIISSSISSINCCLDPLIYYFASSQCQRYVSSLLRWKRNDRPPVHTEQVPLRTHSAQLTKSE